MLLQPQLRIKQDPEITMNGRRLDDVRSDGHYADDIDELGKYWPSTKPGKFCFGLGSTEVAISAANIGDASTKTKSAARGTELRDRDLYSRRQTSGVSKNSDRILVVKSSMYTKNSRGSKSEPGVHCTCQLVERGWIGRMSAITQRRTS